MIVLSFGMKVRRTENPQTKLSHALRNTLIGFCETAASSNHKEIGNLTSDFSIGGRPIVASCDMLGY